MTQGASKKQKQGEIVSLAKLASILGRTDPTIRAYIKSGMPVEKRGASGKGYQLDTAKCIEWLVENAVNGVQGSTNNFDANRNRKMAADADKSEMERDQMRGKTVEVDIAVGIISEKIQAFRSRVLNLPSKVAVKLAALKTRAECLEYLSDELTKLLQELSGGPDSS